MKKTSTIYKVILGIICIIVIFSVSYYFAATKKNEDNVGKIEKMTNSTAKVMTDYVDVVYYINLDDRKDRNDEFLAEMEKVGFPKEKIVRISAVHKKERGHLGCSLSHIETLKKFIKTDYRNCIVFEDDFEFTQYNDNINEAFQNLVDNNVEFDVCMLSGNVYDTEPVAEYPFIKKAVRVWTTSGYMLSKNFAPTLLENFKEGAKKLDKSYDERVDIKKTDPTKYNYIGEYALDQYWTSLQKSSNWYIFEPKLGNQRKSYSDIMEGTVMYAV